MTLTSLSLKPYLFQGSSRPRVNTLGLLVMMFAFSFCGTTQGIAQTKPAPAPDILVLSNGDTLHGKLVNSVDGKVTFHSDPLGDVSLSWDKIKELRTSGGFAVIEDGGKQLSKKAAASIPIGPLKSPIRM